MNDIGPIDVVVRYDIISRRYVEDYSAEVPQPEVNVDLAVAFGQVQSLIEHAQDSIVIAAIQRAAQEVNPVEGDPAYI
jgi:hypothetical protein